MPITKTGQYHTQHLHEKTAFVGGLLRGVTAVGKAGTRATQATQQGLGAARQEMGGMFSRMGTAFSRVKNNPGAAPRPSITKPGAPNSTPAPGAAGTNQAAAKAAPDPKASTTSPHDLAADAAKTTGADKAAPRASTTAPGSDVVNDVADTVTKSKKRFGLGWKGNLALTGGLGGVGAVAAARKEGQGTASPSPGSSSGPLPSTLHSQVQQITQ